MFALIIRQIHREKFRSSAGHSCSSTDMHVMAVPHCAEGYFHAAAGKPIMRPVPGMCSPHEPHHVQDGAPSEVPVAEHRQPGAAGAPAVQERREGRLELHRLHERPPLIVLHVHRCSWLRCVPSTEIYVLRHLNTRVCFYAAPVRRPTVVKLCAANLD